MQWNVVNSIGSLGRRRIVCGNKEYDRINVEALLPQGVHLTDATIDVQDTVVTEFGTPMLSPDAMETRWLVEAADDAEAVTIRVTLETNDGQQFNFEIAYTVTPLITA